MVELLISFKWPIVILIALWFFREHVRDILNSISSFSKRAKSIRYRNFDLDLGSEIFSSRDNQQQGNESQHFKLEKAYQSSIVTNEEKIIASQLAEAQLSPAQAIAILTNHLANANLIINMLKINGLIFEEQIWLLSFLNEQFKPCSEHDLFPFYERWLSRTGNKDYSYVSFMDFLLRERLVAQSLNGYGISILGKEYLAFLVRIGRRISQNCENITQGS